jgi:guanosine-3',5'-bis(diphosphate) 3'-pyrophosphohydrolase
MNHLTEVAELVAEASDGDIALIIAAVLHDSVEDTEATLEELEALFGAEVASLVAEVTDDKSLPKQVRKELQIEHAAHASNRAKMIKMADKVSNLRSLASSPPAHWDAERIQAYYHWAARVVEGCRPANEQLAAKFDAAYQAARV